MKKLLYILIGFILWNCSEEELKTYDGISSIYFNSKNVSRLFIDSLEYSFFVTESYDTIINIPVKAVGNMYDYDRYFKVAIDSTNAQVGVDYEALQSEYVFPAGVDTTSIPIKIYRRDELEDQLYISLRLVENEYFKPNMDTLSFYANNAWHELPNPDRFKFIFTSEYIQPTQWRTAYFGYFSRAKFELLNELTNLRPADWLEMTNSEPGVGMIIAYALVLENYIRTKVAEGPEEALKDPSPNSTRGYMSMEGKAGNTLVIPEEWPDAW